VSGAVNVRVVTRVALVLDVRRRNGDTALTLFRRIVDLSKAYRFTTVLLAITLVIAAVSVVLPWST
jgi:hypothetical protein